MPLALSAILLWFFINAQKRRHQAEMMRKDHELQQQKLLLEKQSVVEVERARIASEMHDDLGAGLTTIIYLSEKAIEVSANQEEKSNILKISEQSSQLIRNMSEIIWALNIRHDGLAGTLAYIRRYCYEYLDEHKIKLNWEQTSIPPNIKLTGERRRNLLLVVKEVLHNVFKHAAATEVNIHSYCTTELLVLQIRDNGKGFELSDENDIGNGIFNMQKRMSDSSGVINIRSNSQGTEINLTMNFM